MTVYIQGLKDMYESNMISKSFIMFLIEGFEDTINRMKSHEKNFSDLNSTLTKDIQELEKNLKNKEVEIQQLTDKNSKYIKGLEKENSDLRDEKLKLMETILELKQEIGQFEIKSIELQEQIEMFKQYEIDRLDETDLEDVDLISEASKKKLVSKKPPHPLVPCLNLDKMRKLQEDELNKLRIIKNELDEDIPFQDDILGVGSHDDEVEDRTSVETQYHEHFYEGSPINSTDQECQIREQDLMLRKAHVINQLNEIYANEQNNDQDESDATEYSNQNT